MPTNKLNILLPLSSNANELATRNSYHQFWNFAYDDEGNVKSRPGHSEWLDLATNRPMFGYFWRAADRFMVVSGGTLYAIDRFGAYTSVATTLQPNRTTYFTDDGTRLFMASRGQVLQYELGGTPAALLDPLAPSAVTTPVMFDGYLLMNEYGTNRVWFGEYTEPAPYTGQPYKINVENFFSAETDSSPVVAVIPAWRQLVVFKTTGVEFWANDGATPFSRSGSVITNHGILYPGAAVVAVDTIFAFTQRRRIVRIDNAQVTDISDGIATELSALGTIDDVESSYVQAGNDEYVMFHFPTEGVSYVYDLKKGAWMKWGVWSTSEVKFNANICSSYVHAPAWNKWFGLTRDGRVMEVDEDTALDGTDMIRSVLRSGFFDGDSPLRKFGVKDTIVARRGIGTYDVANPLNTNYAPVLSYKYRNDTDMDWTDWPLSLGKPGQYFQQISCPRTGTFFQRQYEIEYMSDAPLTLRSVYSEVETAAF